MDQISSSCPKIQATPDPDSRRFYRNDLEAEIKRLTLNSIAPNTKNSYSSSLRIFEQFRLLYELNLIWPPPVSHICSFIAHLSLKGLAHATISSYISGIGFKCKLVGAPDNSQNFLVRKLLEGIKRSKHSKDCRLPITKNILKKLINATSLVCSSKFETILFSSAFSLAYHGFLRVGEFTANSNGKNQTIRIEHFKFKTNHKSGVDYIELKIPFSKTDQSGKGVLITLEPAKNSICPVLWLKKYLSIRPIVSGQLFMHLNGSPLTRFQFCSILNKCLEIAGLPKSRYKSHSFRIGAASDSFSYGHSESEIKKQGRWSSNAFQNYIRLQ